MSPRSITSYDDSNISVPMKKIVKRSRWVSIYDGRPASPFVETVAYVPKYTEYPARYDERLSPLNGNYKMPSK